MVTAIVMVMEQEALPTGQLLMVTTIVMVMEQDSRNVNESLGLFFAQRKCRFELNFLNLFLWQPVKFVKSLFFFASPAPAYVPPPNNCDLGRLRLLRRLWVLFRLLAWGRFLLLCTRRATEQLGFLPMYGSSAFFEQKDCSPHHESDHKVNVA